VSYLQDGGLLHFNHPICHQTKELGHKPFYNFSPVDKLQADGKVLTLAASRAPGVQAMVRAEAGLRTEDGNSGNLLEKLTARADVRVQMDHHPQRRPNIKHPHSL
jgi:hypothetical protein